jgi:hypothetical protein
MFYRSRAGQDLSILKKLILPLPLVGGDGYQKTGLVSGPMFCRLTT